MQDIKPEAQAKAAHALLDKIEDAGRRVRIGRLMIAQLKKDQEAGVEKSLELVMRGNTGTGAMGHVRYVLDLMIVEAAILHAIENKQLAPKVG